MQVFIDANIYLGFIESAGIAEEKGNSIKLLGQEIRNRNIKLIFPEITRNEAYRNVSRIRKASLVSLRRGGIKKAEIPWIQKDSKEEKQLERYRSKYNTKLTTIEKAYINKVEKILKRIESLYKKRIKLGDEYPHIQKALYRRYLGKPPLGKDRLGDELAWEIMLSACTGDDLVIVSFDGDWSKTLKYTEKPKINELLSEEWKQKTDKKISLYTSLASMLKEKGSNTTKSQLTQNDVEKEEKRNAETSQYIIPKFYNQVIGSNQIVTSPSLATLSVQDGFINLKDYGEFKALGVPTMNEIDTNTVIVGANSYGVCIMCHKQLTPLESYDFGGNLCADCFRVKNA